MQDFVGHNGWRCGHTTVVILFTKIKIRYKIYNRAGRPIKYDNEETQISMEDDNNIK